MSRQLIVFILILAAFPLSANETSFRTIQSGHDGNTTPVSNHGIHGEGQIIAILDTGLDYDHCAFAEPDNSPPPINTGSPTGGFASGNVDTTRRKVIAYNFLFSCDQYPGRAGCDDPRSPAAYDNQGHGTHGAASAAADKGAPILHDYADALASAAKLVIQDAGYTGGDFCSQFPGLDCPIRNLSNALEQAWSQGARIHSNSWGDRQGSGASIPPTANYPQSAFDVDQFVFTHPDMLVIFNSGNTGRLGASSVSAPGSAKNTLQVGGTRYGSAGDDAIVNFSAQGPTRDGRIKPDIVAPALVLAGDTDFDVTTRNCNHSVQGGTSWSSPTVAGAAALVRQYYVDGFYPSGQRSSNTIIPSAALMKATLIAAGRRATLKQATTGYDPTLPIPSYEQGFGFPVLGDVLYFPGDVSRLRVADIPLARGLLEGQQMSGTLRVRTGAKLKFVLVWTDPPGHVAGVGDSSPQLINDLDLTLTTPNGESRYGNEVLHPGAADRLNNVEGITIDAPTPGIYRYSVRANRIGQGPRQGFALVITGDVQPVSRPRSARR